MTQESTLSLTQVTATPSSSSLRNERKNRWKMSWFPITGTHRALNEILNPCWNPSCLTIVSFVHFYPSYRKLKRKVFRAITISDLTQNLNYNSVLYTFHFNTHTIFSVCENEPISAFSEPWLHLKGSRPSQRIHCAGSVHYHKCMKWSHIFSITPFMQMPFPSTDSYCEASCLFHITVQELIPRAIKVLLCITV